MPSYPYCGLSPAEALAIVEQLNPAEPVTITLSAHCDLTGGYDAICSYCNAECGPVLVALVDDPLGDGSTPSELLADPWSIDVAVAPDWRARID